MDPGSSTENASPPESLELEEVGALLPALARRSVVHYLWHERRLEVDERLPRPLNTPYATFVTLRCVPDGALRGCIGTLTPELPLARSVAHHAVQAATADPRFPPVAIQEVRELYFSVSVLQSAEPLHVADEKELLARLNPGEDGLTLYEGACRATFLPAVWERLPEPEAFLRELKRKAGLPEDYWSPSLTVERYRTETFTEEAPEA